MRYPKPNKEVRFSELTALRPLALKSRKSSEDARLFCFKPLQKQLGRRIKRSVLTRSFRAISKYSMQLTISLAQEQQPYVDTNRCSLSKHWRAPFIYEIRHICGLFRGKNDRFSCREKVNPSQNLENRHLALADATGHQRTVWTLMGCR